MWCTAPSCPKCQVTVRSIIRLKETNDHNKKDVTVSVLSVSKWWWHSDDASLSNTHSQKALIHTCDQPANPDVSVIGAHAGVAAAKSGGEKLHVCVCVKCGIVCVNVVMKVWNKPGIKERSIQQGAIVVVADVVRNLHLSGADQRGMVGVTLDAIFWVPYIEQQDVKMENGVGRDDVTWREDEINQFLFQTAVLNVMTLYYSSHISACICNVCLV